MEGGSEIHFDVFQVETLHEDNKKNSIAVKVRIAGNYRQNPHLYFDKRYRFDTRREYEFFMVSEGQWRPFVKSMRRLFEEEGSTEIFQ